MSCVPPRWFERIFTGPRLAPYQEAARCDGTHAEGLYCWNLQVSEAFYPALSCLEISLRNALHKQMQARYGRPDWWASAPLDKHDAVKVQQASDDLSRRNGIDPRSVDSIVAELSFGFWVSLLSRRYDRYFWVPALHKAFPGYHGDRETLRDNLQAMLRLRNRIMHHEPIHHRHLAADHAKIYRLLGYIEPEAVTWLRGFDRVPEVLARRPGGDDHVR
jgi:hypothetical protein